MPRNHQMASVTVFLVFIFQEQLFPGSGLLHNWFLQGNHLLNFPNVCSFNVFKSITNFKGLNFNLIQEMLNQDFDDLRKSERKLWNRKKKLEKEFLWPIHTKRQRLGKCWFGILAMNLEQTHSFSHSRNWRICATGDRVAGDTILEMLAHLKIYLYFLWVGSYFPITLIKCFKLISKCDSRKKIQSSSITKNA